MGSEIHYRKPAHDIDMQCGRYPFNHPIYVDLPSTQSKIILKYAPGMTQPGQTLFGGQLGINDDTFLGMKIDTEV